MANVDFDFEFQHQMQNSVSISELGFENSIESFLAPLDQYPDIRVFVKDMHSRYVYANKAYADMLKTTPQGMIDKSDFDLYDHNFAELYLAEDRQTLAGKDFINQRWMVPDGSGVISWCVAHKFPLRNRDRDICGIICTFRDQQMAGIEAKPFFNLAEVIEYVNTNYAEPIRAEQLARLIGVSVSQLNRKFAKVMGKSPIRYLVSVRVNKAINRLINTDDSVTEICFSCGFNNQTYFNRQFKAITGFSPRDYRNRYT